MATTPILYLEDDQNDVKMVRRCLQKAGFPFAMDVVSNEKDFISYLHKCSYKIVLIDFQLPSFNGVQALKIISGLQPHLPCIMISGVLKEEEFVECLKLGAIDYILKGSLTRLVPAIKRALQEANERVKTEKAVQYSARLSKVVEQTADAVIITDFEGAIEYVNNAFEISSGYSLKEVLGKNPRCLQSGLHDLSFYQALWKSLLENGRWQGQITNKTKSGSLIHEDTTISTIYSVAGEISGFVSIKRDITERLTMEDRLRQSQKLEAIGQLAAGITHEINTPIQYIGSNVDFFQEGIDDIISAINQLDSFISSESPPSSTAISEALSQQLEAIDWPYLMEELPEAIQQTKEGVKRITKIVHALKELSHPGENVKTTSDLNHIIETSIIISENEWKYDSKIETDLDSSIPQPMVFADKISQVIINMIVNACHAIQEKKRLNNLTDYPGKISITTGLTNNTFTIKIADNGIGIAKKTQEKIFQPFFTTKKVGKGTGQGLSIAFDVIVNQHNGSIELESDTNQGSIFTMHIPLGESD